VRTSFFSQRIAANDPNIVPIQRRSFLFIPYCLYSFSAIIPPSAKPAQHIQMDWGDAPFVELFYTVFLILIDIFTKKVWVYPSKTKSVKDLKRILDTWWEEVKNFSPKIVQCDNAGEYVCPETNEWMKEHGIDDFRHGRVRHPQSQV